MYLHEEIEIRHPVGKYMTENGEIIQDRKYDKTWMSFLKKEGCEDEFAGLAMTTYENDIEFFYASGNVK